ncbi:MAG: Ltp family lipoprotein [Eubacterium sp.]|nr:Ltp family lipoprotein [Eubacterium sp.]
MKKRVLSLICAAALFVTGCSSASSGKTGSIEKNDPLKEESISSSSSSEAAAVSSESESTVSAFSESPAESLYTFQLETLAFQVPQDFWGDPVSGGDDLTFFYHYENDESEMAMLQFQSQDAQGLTADEFKDMKDDIAEGFAQGMESDGTITGTDTSEVEDRELGGLPGVYFTAGADYSGVPLSCDVYLAIDESADKMLAAAYFKTSGISSETDDNWKNIIDTALPADQVTISTPAPSDDSDDSDDESDSSDSEKEGTNDDKDAALEEAKTTLEYSSYSHDGLVEYLQYAGYTHEAAVYAADNVGADWKEEALESAEDYVEYSSMSESNLKEMLEFEEFTADEVSYAMDNIQVDYNAEAKEDLQSWKDYDSSMSDDKIREMMELDGFTDEQIDAAMAG